MHKISIYWYILNMDHNNQKKRQKVVITCNHQMEVRFTIRKKKLLILLSFNYLIYYDETFEIEIYFDNVILIIFNIFKTISSINILHSLVQP